MSGVDKTTLLEEFQRRQKNETEESEPESKYNDSDLVSKNVNNFIIYSCAEGLIIQSYKLYIYI
jgi:hypothetical protein